MKAVLLALLLLAVFSISSCVRLYDDELMIYFVRAGNIYQITESGNDLTLILSGATYNYPCSSPDGRYLLCRFGAQSAIYDLETLSQYRVFPTASPFTHSWSPDGSKVAATDGPGTTKVYDVLSGTFLWTSGGGGKSANYFTYDSAYITETNGATLNEYTPAVDTIPERSRVMPGTYSGLTLSPDGRRLAGRSGPTIVLLDEATLVVIATVPGTNPSWSPDNESLACDVGGNIVIYNTRSGSSRQITFSGADSYPCYRYMPK